MVFYVRRTYTIFTFFPCDLKPQNVLLSHKFYSHPFLFIQHLYVTLWTSPFGQCRKKKKILEEYLVFPQVESKWNPLKQELSVTLGSSVPQAVPDTQAFSSNDKKSKQLTAPGTGLSLVHFISLF